MADQQYTEADVEQIAQAMRDANTPEVWILGPQMVPMAHFAKVALDHLAAAGRLLPEGAKTDLIHPDGTHTYWSTHCRHAPSDDLTAPGHRECSLSVGYDREGQPFYRKPAQCKTCASPCICPCHAGSADG